MRCLALARTVVFGSVFACVPQTPSLPAPASAHLEPRASGTCNEALLERLVVDWSPLERSKLEAAARRGVVMLRVRGCDVTIADRCAAPATASRPPLRYSYTATSRQREVDTMRSIDEIRAQLPFGVSRFGGLVGQKTALEVSMTVVGRYDSPIVTLSASDLQGECEGVTHSITSLSVGSFAIATDDDTSLAANADLVFASARAERGSERRHLDSAGVESTCAEARRSDVAPPEDCGVPLRIELRRIGASQRVVSEPSNATQPAATAEQSSRFAALIKRATLPCYRSALGIEPHLSGSLTLMVTVGVEGAVRRVSAQHDVPDGLADCVVHRTQRVVFPIETGHATQMFMVPLVFAAK